MNEYIIVPWVPTEDMVYAMENSCWDSSDRIPIDKNSIQYAMWVQVWQDAIRVRPGAWEVDLVEALQDLLVGRDPDMGGPVDRARAAIKAAPSGGP